MITFQFKRPKNAPEFEATAAKKIVPSVPDGLYFQCKKCNSSVLMQDFSANSDVCPICGKHYRLSGRARLKTVCDENTFSEFDKNLSSKNVLEFEGYEEKLEKARQSSGENEGVICGTAKIKGFETAVFAMDADFMMGSMGITVGEKITRLFEYATKNKLPVIGFTVSGGARMQEGMFSLMQMAKTSGAVKLHSEAGLLYIAVLTDPTTGGVTASFAMEADITLAEPEATIGFAGARVIEQTMRQKLPSGFQTAEFVMEKGFIDSIVKRSELKNTLTNLLSLHSEEKI